MKNGWTHMQEEQRIKELDQNFLVICKRTIVVKFFWLMCYVQVSNWCYCIEKIVLLFLHFCVARFRKYNSDILQIMKKLFTVFTVHLYHLVIHIHGIVMFDFLFKNKQKIFVQTIQKLVTFSWPLILKGNYGPKL